MDADKQVVFPIDYERYICDQPIARERPWWSVRIFWFTAQTTIVLAIALIYTQAAIAQEDSSLEEAEVRATAIDLIFVTEAKFECKIKEHSMKELGRESDVLYLFRLDMDGEDCDEALVYLLIHVAHDSRIIFRSVEDRELIIEDGQFRPTEQGLIHEVNPGIDED